MENFLVTLLPSGWQASLAPGQTLLAGLEAAGLQLPSSCRNGSCRTCMCQLDAGAVRHLPEWPGLSAEEKSAGWILPCVALGLADLVLRAPAARRSMPGA